MKLLKSRIRLRRPKGVTPFGTRIWGMVVAEQSERIPFLGSRWNGQSQSENAPGISCTATIITRQEPSDKPGFWRVIMVVKEVVLRRVRTGWQRLTADARFSSRTVAGILLCRNLPRHSPRKPCPPQGRRRPPGAAAGSSLQPVCARYPRVHDRSY